jgi:alanine racemase
MTDSRNQLLSWCEVDAEALSHNLSTLRSLLAPTTQLLLVVKSNAYGHGLPLVTRLARKAGADALGVHSLDEAIQVRAAQWNGMVLIMGYVHRSRLAEAAELEADLTVFDHASLAEIDRLGRRRGKPVRCHLKLETGTNRQGIPEEELGAYLERFGPGSGVTLAGLSMHFANIEDTTDHSYARLQLATFQRMADRVKAAGIAGISLHTACTAAVLTMPETGFDLARVGIGAYGLWPSRETLASTRASVGAGIELRPVLSWKARVAQVKWVSAGSFIGYGCSHRTSRRTRLAVIPIGYADGFARQLSGLAHVLVNGQRAPVLGRICMNMFMVEVTDIDSVETEDEVILIGRQGREEVSCVDLAAQAQSIPYEIVSRISQALPRLAVDGRGRLLPD